MKGLRFFQRTNVPGDWCIAYFHSPHSLTWRWSLSFRRFRGDEWRVWPLARSHRDNSKLLQWWFRVPFIGIVDFHQQRPMWYRDLYMRLRDEDDQRRGLMWCSDNHPHKLRESQVPPSPAPTVSGGASLH